MNMKTSLVIVTAGFILLMGNLSAKEAFKQNPQEKKVQTDCPVLGEPINKNLYVDFQGKRIYVCCDDCIEKVNADPEKYIKEIEGKGIVLDATPVEKENGNKKAKSKGASCH